MPDVVRRETGGAGGDEETAHAVVGAGPDDGDVGDRAVGDPHLGAVEHPVAPVPPGVRAHGARVGAGVRLGQPEAADEPAGGHAGQPLLLLFLRAVLPDGVHRQGALDGDEAAQAGVDGFEFQAGQAVGHGTGTGAAVALQVHAEHTRLAQPSGEFPRGYGSPLEPVRDVGAQVAVAHGADGVADVAFLVGQQGVDPEQVEGVEGRGRHRCLLAAASARTRRLTRRPTAQLTSRQDS